MPLGLKSTGRSISAVFPQFAHLAVALIVMGILGSSFRLSATPQGFIRSRFARA